MGRKKKEKQEEQLVQKGIWVNKDLYKQFKSQANLEDIGVSKLISILMEDYLINKAKNGIKDNNGSIN